MDIKKAWLWILYAGAFLSGIILSGYLVSRILLTERKEVVVPDIRGKELIEAWQILKRKSLELEIYSLRHYEGAPRYVIIDQKPSPGTPVKKKQIVSVTLSLGRERFLIPDLRGIPVENARRLIENSGFVLKNLLRISSSSPEGEVIAQFPPPGTEYMDREISLLVSKGQYREFLSPSFVGKTVKEVEELLRPYGIPVRIRYLPEKDGEMDVICEHVPPEGGRLSTAGEGVEVFVPGSPPEGMVFRTRISPGFLKKSLEIRLNSDKLSLKIFNGMVERGKYFYLLLPRGKEGVEILIDGRRVKWQER